MKKAAHRCPQRVPRAGNPGSHVALRGFLPRKTIPRDLYQATVIAKPLNDDIRLSGEPRMTPNRQSPAYALFAQSWPPCGAANSASASSALTMEYSAHGSGLSRLRIKIRRQDKHCTGGGGPQILSAFVKQRTYQPLPARNSAHPELSRHTGDLFGRISKVRLASPEELPRKPRNISSGHDSP